MVHMLSSHVNIYLLKDKQWRSINVYMSLVVIVSLHSTKCQKLVVSHGVSIAGVSHIFSYPLFHSAPCFTSKKNCEELTFRLYFDNVKDPRRRQARLLLMITGWCDDAAAFSREREKKFIHEQVELDGAMVGALLRIALWALSVSTNWLSCLPLLFFSLCKKILRIIIQVVRSDLSGFFWWICFYSRVCTYYMLHIYVLIIIIICAHITFFLFRRRNQRNKNMNWTWTTFHVLLTLRYFLLFWKSFPE